MQAGYCESMLSVLPPGSRVVMVPESGHFLQIERPQVTAEAILDYLGDRQGPR